MSTPWRRSHAPELSAMRARLAHAQGQQYWRSLDELAQTDEFLQYLRSEFPEQASELVDPVSRRRFLQLMGASLALAGATACTGTAAEKIVPYVRQPEDLVPGQPQHYASAISLGGYATGVLVESHMGRPTKIEGNPEHPASRGASDSITQAAVLGLYDPDRSQTVLRNGRISTWETFLATVSTMLMTMEATGDPGLRLLTQTVTSPSLGDQILQLLQKYPGSKWHQYEPVARDGAVRGAEQSFGEALETRYELAGAKVLLTLDANLFGLGPGAVRYTRDFAATRRVNDERRQMSRLYAVESSPTITGTAADHRWRLRTSQVEAFARAVAARLGVSGLLNTSSAAAEFEALQTGIDEAWIDALAADLLAHGGESAVIAGAEQPGPVHAVAHAINEHLGNVGTTVIHSDPVPLRPVDQVASLRDLVADMNAGDVELLVIIDGNPAYDAPADLGFVEAIQQVPMRVRLGVYEDETSEHCHWHVPQADALESWGDGRAFDGTVTMLQPLIEPLYGGRSPNELLAVLLGQPERDGLEIVRSYWQERWRAGAFGAGAVSFEASWGRALHDGFVAGTALPGRDVTVRGDWDQGPAAPVAGLEVVFRPDPTIYDGRFSNNGWLQETPKPHSKLTWDNAVTLSPATAAEQGIAAGDVVALTVAETTVEGAAWILPGHVDGAVTVALGYGRRRAGRVGRGTGFDVYPLRTSGAMWTAAGAAIGRTGARRRLASTQHHFSMEGRDLVRVGVLEEFRATGSILTPHTHVPDESESLYPAHEYDGYSWGMAIDLNTCVGCNGCVTACQAENNIPVVGKDQVLNGREMHWIRVDRYYAGGVDTPDSVFQPVTCMHCENAPCEVVCPVAATVHGPEGLNEMVYNRCVGTRYCANNCPYKVRRFNFLDYTDTTDTPVLDLLHNPDVTVRSRGVMEKCTYCVQRINRGRIAAKSEGRQLRDGDVVTACQQACPAQAIVFGDINDPDSAISRARQEPLHYGLLTETGTRPRTNYLAKLRNPNPAIGDRVPEVGDEH